MESNYKFTMWPNSLLCFFLSAPQHSFTAHPTLKAPVGLIRGRASLSCLGTLVDWSLDPCWGFWEDYEDIQAQNTQTRIHTWIRHRNWFTAQFSHALVFCAWGKTSTVKSRHINWKYTSGIEICASNYMKSVFRIERATQQLKVSWK